MMPFESILIWFLRGAPCWPPLNVREARALHSFAMTKHKTFESESSQLKILMIRTNERPTIEIEHAHEMYIEQIPPLYLEHWQGDAIDAADHSTCRRTTKIKLKRKMANMEKRSERGTKEEEEKINFFFCICLRTMVARRYHFVLFAGPRLGRNAREWSHFFRETLITSCSIIIIYSYLSPPPSPSSSLSSVFYSLQFLSGHTLCVERRCLLFKCYSGFFPLRCCCRLHSVSTLMGIGVWITCGEGSRMLSSK